MGKRFFITAIDTDSGKTVVSAILMQAMKADYWKPVQAGISEQDSDTIRSLLPGTDSRILKERYVLKEPESPHAAAAKENISINLTDFNLPEHKNNLIIEGAGGLLVPFNDEHFMIDIANVHRIPVILVCNFYLGSINHSLLSLAALTQKGCEVTGVIFNGRENKESKEIILRHCPFQILGSIPFASKVDTSFIEHAASKLAVFW